MSNRSKTLGIYAWPPHIQAEGVNAVLDNLQSIGATSVSTSTYVAEPAIDGEGDRREPPQNGNKGLVREIDRPLWGRKALYLHTGPSFSHDSKLYDGMKYAPEAPNDLTRKHGDVIHNFLAEANKRGLKTYIQTSPSRLPTLRDGVDESERLADTPRLPFGKLPANRMVNFASLASPAVVDFMAAETADIIAEYPEADGLLLDRMEQSFYTFDDAFVDYGSHAQKAAEKYGLDFESINGAAGAALQHFASITNDELDSVQSKIDIPIAFPGLAQNDSSSGQSLNDAMKLRSKTASHLLKTIRESADSVRPEVELIPITFPPPLSLLTGVDFSKYSKYADAVMIKFFTMHWPLIVTYWTEGITAMNPTLDPNKVARAVSIALELEDVPSTNAGDYAYPEPDTPHRAGTNAQISKIKVATKQAKKMPILPSVHGYGPLEDVERRWRIGWETGDSGMWVNRYGYLSEPKLNLLKRVIS
ncbi:MAG: hypothetical protein HOJ22_06480 [Chloroflexi bacterium]|jgi:hypothetical protein|nr:hypothetical protein [Chloroflexota bacterium]MBT5627920.1 hypothetical protein [Chloroflexota bacterium]